MSLASESQGITLTTSASFNVNIWHHLELVIFYCSCAMFLPNVVKGELWDQCKKYEYWWPTTNLRAYSHIWKISNDHNSATRQPIPFMFGSRVGFLGTVDRAAPFLVGSNPRWQPAAILKNSNCHISAMHRHRHVYYAIVAADKIIHKIHTKMQR